MSVGESFDSTSGGSHPFAILVASLIAAALAFGVWQFVAHRPAPAAKTFRIYLLGGSTALGDPYAPKADLGQIVSLWFGGEIKGRKIEVVNLGGRGTNVHFEDRLENGQLVFDYRMRPGVVARSNALDLMRAVGLRV